ncbi:MAG: hypothetical protein KDM64_01315 [Verrucomicrobiae bacterium]|nr:hypothetical protein [Verrucomicrobiae bacterium]
MPPHHRHISRVVFYVGVMIVLWVMGRFTQPEASLLPSDDQLGVARPFIGSHEVPWFATLPQGR